MMCNNLIKAQDYQNAIGVRVGNYNGLTYKTFIAADKAIDLNLAFDNGQNDDDDYKNVFLTALYQVHNPFPGANGLKWYYGAGGSLGRLKYKKLDGKIFLSIDGVLGLDYKLAEAPLNFSFDWRPRLGLTPASDLYINDVGLAIRFTF